MDYTQEVSDAYNTQRNQFNVISDACLWEAFRKQVSDVAGKRILDLGSGRGEMLGKLAAEGAHCVGVDAYSAMIETAWCEHPGIEFVQHNIADPFPFPNDYFDAIISSWTLQVLPNMTNCFLEVARVLKPGGAFVFLTKHPLSQWEMRGTEGKNYFEQVMVTARIFAGTITVTEPSHTITDYFQSLINADLSICGIKEEYEIPSSELMRHNIYPTFLIIAARKGQ